MRTILASVGALLISAAILLTGGGLLSTLVAVRAQSEGFALPLIGLLLSSYYAGFVIGCFVTPYSVARVGHIRAFAALAALAAAAVLCHAISQNVIIWLILRLITGFSFAGLYMIVESWINEKSTNKMRGQVLSIYRVVDLVAVTAGQYMLILANPAGFILFSLVTMLIVISIVPIAMTKAMVPEPITQTSLNLPKLLQVSPIAVVGAFSVGMANGAFWGIAPVFVQQLGYEVMMVPVFMSVAIISGALAQWPVGYISDLVDRRIVLIAVAGACTFSGIFLSVYATSSLPLLLIGSGLYGLFAMPIFGLSAAHANDYAQDDEFVAISGGLLLLYGIGSIIGPVLASLVMQAASPQWLFAYTALVHVLLAIFGLYRLTRRYSIPVEYQEDYVPVPRTTPAIFEIDPRNISTEAEDT